MRHCERGREVYPPAADDPAVETGVGFDLGRG
jgi:hypothetical protein